MGDTPVEIPNDKPCPYGVWPGGLQPSIIKGSFSGIMKNPLYPTYPDPYNGGFRLNFVTCNRYHQALDGCVINLWITGSDLKLEQIVYPTRYSFVGFAEFGQGAIVFVAEGMYPSAYYDGIGLVDLAASGFSQKASWEPAGLIGVPEQLGYFAEQGYSGLDEKHYRYANHSNRTNVKLILE